MSQRDSKAESVKTDANYRTSRRALLTAGAAAVAGAAAAVVAPSTAKAHHLPGNMGPGVYEHGTPAHGPKIATVSYHPNEGLVSVIIRAWQNDNFKNRLLSFNNDADASNVSTAPNYQRSRRRLGRVGQVFIDKPVVITETQYKNGYVKRHDDEVVFVLPNTPEDVLEGSDTALGNSARALMAAVPFGM